jgi:hypothetical protein
MTSGCSEHTAASGRRVDGWTLVLRRQPVHMVAGRPDCGYADAFELICCDCGDDPYQICASHVMSGIEAISAQTGRRAFLSLTEGGAGVRLRLVTELAGPGRNAVERFVERVPVAPLCIVCVPGRFLGRWCR